jgi:hypothetical protein
MSYFGKATTVISEIGGHGDTTLSGDEYNRDDRYKRIAAAASSLCDWVFEYMLENGDFETSYLGEKQTGIFRQEHLPRIARMCAIAMMVQFECDLEGEERLAQLLKDQTKKFRFLDAI